MNTGPQLRKLRVFLCHASKDKPVIRQLSSRLNADGAETWFDEDSLLPGQDWDSEVRKAIHGADVVLACLSSASITRTGYVQKELRYILDVADEQPDDTIFVIPAKLDDCIIPARLRRWQWVALTESRGYDMLLRALSQRAQSLGLLGIGAASILTEINDVKRNRPGAVATLVKRGMSALPYLLDAFLELSVTDPAREPLQYLLAAVGAAALPIYLARIAELDPHYDSLACIALTEVIADLHGADIVDRLCDALHSTSASVRKVAADALGKIADPVAVPYLLNILTAPDLPKDDGLLYHVGWSLAHISDPLTVPVLVQLLDCDNERLAWTAATALSRLEVHAAPAIPALIRRLRKGWIYAEALGNIPDARVVQPLIDALRDELSASESSDPEPYIRALESLGPLATAAIPTLIYAMRPDEHVRYAASEALVAIGSEAVPALIEALGSEHWTVRASAADALRELGPPQDAIAALLEVAGNSHEVPQVIEAASEALRRIRPGIPPEGRAS